MASQVNPSIPADGVAVPKGDIRDNFLATRDEIEALQAGKLDSGAPIDMQDQVLAGAVLQDFSEISPSLTVNGGTLQLDLATGSVFVATLNDDVTTLDLPNPPVGGKAGSATLILWQDSTGGRTVTWPSSVRWPGGQPPVVTSGPNSCDIFSFVTRNGGSLWFGFVGGQDFR